MSSKMNGVGIPVCHQASCLQEAGQVAWMQRVFLSSHGASGRLQNVASVFPYLCHYNVEFLDLWASIL
eukprot:142800-Pelagomonas_calceolata.AAC.8